MFGNDKIHITEIQTVLYVNSDTGKRRQYFDGNLPTYELIYRISGENISTFNGKKNHTLPGMIEFLPKGIKNAEYYVDKIHYGDCIDILFDTDFPMPNESMVIDTTSNPHLIRLFTKMYQTWITIKGGYYFECMSIFYQILYQLQKINQPYMPQNLFEKIEKGIQYLNENCFAENLSYKTCSEICNISYSYFKRLFIKKFKMTPSEYIISLRMNHSCELLITNKYSISEIAESVGYKNVYYFSKSFKKTFGCPPSLYIKNYLHYQR